MRIKINFFYKIPGHFLKIKNYFEGLVTTLFEEEKNSFVTVFF